ncbi:hypothetical protein N39L_37210 [Limnospira platensis NIES-39]|uniref:Uncharacterized protein n=1 Tax=Limnospira platensis NIES-46 TaxID=1236695 RepID=A0A5M3TAZ1_LIMPL|nr:hypothetical protein AP285_17060 [Arthrospira platensis YZ]KDR56734.1 hypothetical protein APPUASWS_014700 [Arthrospira platensis str. Paraca]BDT13998.1 hypothetical protein N39L_37210 [Arthrospira platensis NIES-39]GCE94976.1 hypothetical protein NIES46_30360 [Arthrospira platensis NIES-46]
MKIKLFHESFLDIMQCLDGTILINLKVKIPVFERDPQHIKWLCEAHEWLRPYFPFWRGVC